MGQYKVPQNVESEDKLIGPLTMKQFIYALIGLGWGFLVWRLLLPGGSAAYPVMAVLILPISGFMFLLAFGRREEQSFENYLIALIRFTVMPRKRTWMKDSSVLNAIVDTPPPPPPHQTTQAERDQVRSRLQQLALVVDTRGHTKPATVQLPDPQNQAAQFTQRVFTPQDLQNEYVQSEIKAQDDILSGADVGQHADRVGELLQNVEINIRDQARERMQQALQNPSPRAPITSAPAPVQPSPPPPDDAILKTVMNSTNLSVAQVAQTANRGQLQPGQAVSFR